MLTILSVRHTRGAQPFSVRASWALWGLNSTPGPTPSRPGAPLLTTRCPWIPPSIPWGQDRPYLRTPCGTHSFFFFSKLFVFCLLTADPYHFSKKKPTSNVFSYSYLATCASASQLSISCPHRTVSPCLLAPRGGWYAELAFTALEGALCV